MKELGILEKFNNEYTAQQIYEGVTGGVPRYISRLATDKSSSLKDWAGRNVSVTRQDVKRTCEKLPQTDQEGFITFLGSLFTFLASPPPDPIWYDKGFFYKTPEQQLRVINPIVETGLWEYYGSSMNTKTVYDPNQVRYFSRLQLLNLLVLLGEWNAIPKSSFSRVWVSSSYDYSIWLLWEYSYYVDNPKSNS